MGPEPRSSSSYSGLRQLTKNSPKVGVLDRVAGSRSGGRADGTAVTKWSNRPPAPSLGREDFHCSVSCRRRRTADSARELTTKCCGSERPPRWSGASPLGPTAQRLRVRKPGGPLSPTASVVADRKKRATERTYGPRVGCANTGQPPRSRLGPFLAAPCKVRPPPSQPSSSPGLAAEWTCAHKSHAPSTIPPII